MHLLSPGPLSLSFPGARLGFPGNATCVQDWGPFSLVGRSSAHNRSCCRRLRLNDCISEKAGGKRGREGRREGLTAQLKGPATIVRCRGGWLWIKAGGESRIWGQGVVGAVGVGGSSTCPTVSHPERDRTEQWEVPYFRLVVKRVQRPCGKYGRNRVGTRWPERQEEVVPLRTLERNRCAPPSCSLRTVPTTSQLAGGPSLHSALRLPAPFLLLQWHPMPICTPALHPLLL